MIDFESFIEKFVEFDLAKYVSNTVNNKKIIFFLYEEGNFNLLKPLVQASKDKNPQDPNDSDKETLLHKAARDGKLEFVQFLVPLLSDKNPKE